MVDINRIARVRGLDRGLDGSFDVATDVADDPQPGRLLPGEQFLQIGFGHQARILWRPVDGVDQDGRVGEVAGKHAAVFLGMVVVVVQPEPLVRRDGLHHVFFFEDHLVDVVAGGLTVLGYGGHVGGVYLHDGQRVQYLLHTTGNVAVAGDTNDERGHGCGQPFDPDPLAHHFQRGPGPRQPLVGVHGVQGLEWIGYPFPLQPLPQGPEGVHHPRPAGVASEEDQAAALLVHDSLVINQRAAQI